MEMLRSIGRRAGVGVIGEIRRVEAKESGWRYIRMRRVVRTWLPIPDVARGVLQSKGGMDIERIVRGSWLNNGCLAGGQS